MDTKVEKGFIVAEFWGKKLIFYCKNFWTYFFSQAKKRYSKLFIQTLLIRTSKKISHLSTKVLIHLKSYYFIIKLIHVQAGPSQQIWGPGVKKLVMNFFCLQIDKNWSWQPPFCLSISFGGATPSGLGKNGDISLPNPHTPLHTGRINVSVLHFSSLSLLL